MKLAEQAPLPPRARLPALTPVGEGVLVQQRPYVDRRLVGERVMPEQLEGWLDRFPAASGRAGRTTPVRTRVTMRRTTSASPASGGRARSAEAIGGHRPACP